MNDAASSSKSGPYLTPAGETGGLLAVWEMKPIPMSS